MYIYQIDDTILAEPDARKEWDGTGEMEHARILCSVPITILRTGEDVTLETARAIAKACMDAGV